MCTLPCLIQSLSDKNIFDIPVCVTVIYIPLMLFGLLGNILTILVVWLRPHMRSSTYLYLSSMAVSDLFILLLLPLDLYKLWRPRPWPFGDLACKLTMFMSECCTFCTILHITFLSIERYVAVCWPITAKTLVTRRRTRALIGCLWLGAAVSAAPVLVMVGVEEVVGEEPGLGGWREDRGWTGSEGGFMIGEREQGHGEIVSSDGGSEGIKWGENVGEKIVLVEKEERQLETGGRENTKQGDGRKTRDEGGNIKEQRVEVEGMHHKKLKKEDGGGVKESVDGGRGLPDNRECRVTDYAISSGLLSAMMILSNLYFLVPFCILGLVYSLIGRTLWLRPQSSRREQSHRHTVKMLGVIVLAFVLCWLPFHLGRTIFSLSQGGSTDGQEAYPDTNAHLEEMNAVSDCVVSDVSSHTDVDTHMADKATGTQTNMGTQSEDMSIDRDLFSHTTSLSRQRGTHTPAHSSDLSLIDTNNNMHNSTNTSSHNDTHTIADIVTQISNSHSVFIDTSTSTHTYRPSFTDVHTLPNEQNKTPICINSQKNTPPTSGTSIYTLTPTDLYSGTPFNDTYSQPDSHYFLYYLSQYFNLVSSVLFYLSAAVNPLLYNLMSTRYRHAVHSLMHTHSHTQTHRRRTLTGQHSTTTL
ncbi:uncharacterized protein LOC132954145 [Labrus mixtus]|uniref:uncharacterized protein LOC132954145 n=1 Tax=Labrus mixtus TaxID=508554 RepID=UPI0029C0094B|nr:uncharacterized protein LOC132954145 [Labrus mixtus]